MTTPMFPRLILSSKSPRRQYLLREAGFEFDIVTLDTDESFPADMAPAEVPVFLSRKKSEAIQNNGLIITADTVVVIDGKIVNKPENLEQAAEMLSWLSGRDHLVYTGVTIRKGNKMSSFVEKTVVTFKRLEDWEIDFYVYESKPLDKAGAYGIQEWIGYIGVTGIQGCYYNVMGFPISRFYLELSLFIAQNP